MDNIIASYIESIYMDGEQPSFDFEDLGDQACLRIVGEIHGKAIQMALTKNDGRMDWNPEDDNLDMVVETICIKYSELAEEAHQKHINNAGFEYGRNSDEYGDYVLEMRRDEELN